MDILSYLDVLPHYKCAHCKEPNILLTCDNQVFTWLKEFSQYHEVKGEFTCKHCKKKFIYFGALATHLIMEEQIDRIKIIENPKTHFIADIEKKKHDESSVIPFATTSIELPIFKPEKPVAVAPNETENVKTVRAPRSEWTEEQIKLIIEDKLSIPELAKQFGKSVASIYSKRALLAKEGKVTNKKAKNTKIDKEILELSLKEKKPISEIAKYFEITVATVYSFLSKNYSDWKTQFEY